MLPSSFQTSDFDYYLPEDLIAEKPTEKREESRLLVLNRKTQSIRHFYFRDLPQLLSPKDLLVLNNSRVRPSVMRSTDGAIEITLLEEVRPSEWKVLGLPGRKLKPGKHYHLAPLRGKALPPVEMEVLEVLAHGERLLRFLQPFSLDDYASLQLPPYIQKKRERLAADGEKQPYEDEERYQTVFAQPEGSIAAPTAGLHFTQELLAQLAHTFITLHVGVGTFRPVKGENFHEHEMERESFLIPQELSSQASQASRLVAVGTTSCRVLESVPDLGARKGSTNLFIHPPYTFRHVGALITNFHLPKTTLFMLVCAFAGYDFAQRAYAEAIQEKYRFYSYGDVMLID